MNKAFVSHFWKPVKCDIAVTLPLSLLHNTLSGLNIFIMKKKNRCSAVKKGKNEKYTHGYFTSVQGLC